VDWIRGVLGFPLEGFLIHHDGCAALLDVIEKNLVAGHEIRACVIGAHVDEYHIELTEPLGGDFTVCDSLVRNAHPLKGIHDDGVVAGDHAGFDPLGDRCLHELALAVKYVVRPLGHGGHEHFALADFPVQFEGQVDHLHVTFPGEFEGDAPFFPLVQCFECRRRRDDDHGLAGSRRVVRGPHLERHDGIPPHERHDRFAGEIDGYRRGDIETHGFTKSQFLPAARYPRRHFRLGFHERCVEQVLRVRHGRGMPLRHGKRQRHGRLAIGKTGMHGLMGLHLRPSRRVEGAIRSLAIRGARVVQHYRDLPLLAGDEFRIAHRDVHGETHRKRGRLG